jgi:general secretion pathway protein G
MTMRARGFTLIELLVTLAILGLLSALVIPTAQVVVQRRQEQELREALHLIRQGLDAYKLAYDQGRITKTLAASGYPKTLELLVEGVPDLQNPKHAKMYFCAACRAILLTPTPPSASRNPGASAATPANPISRGRARTSTMCSA